MGKEYTIEDDGEDTQTSDIEIKNSEEPKSSVSINNTIKNIVTEKSLMLEDGSEILIAQDGKNPRKLTPVEAGRLQGYCIEGAGWEKPSAKIQEDIQMKIVVSPKEAYHQFGNSVAVPVIKAIAREIKSQLLDKAK